MKKILITLIILLMVVGISAQSGFGYDGGGGSGAFFKPWMEIDSLYFSQLGDNVLIVGENSKFKYNTVTEALVEAAAGYEILVLPGTYAEHIDVDVADITIRSLAGWQQTTLNLTITSNVGMDISVDNIVIDGFTLVSTSARIIELTSAPDSTLIKNCYFDMTKGATMGISGAAAGNSNTVIRNNIFDADSADGCIWMEKTVSDFVLDGNTFYGRDITSSYAFQTPGINNATIINNIIRGNNEIVADGFASGIFIYTKSADGAAADSIYIENNIVKDCAKGIRLGHTSMIYDFDYVWISDNIISDCTDGVYVSADTNTHPATFEIADNIFRDNTTDINNANSTALDVRTNVLSDGSFAVSGTLYTDEIEEVTADAGVTMNSALNVGNLQLTEDGGVMTIADKNITAASSVDETYWFKQDANNILGIGAKGDGAGGITLPYVKAGQGVFSMIEITTPTAIASSGAIYTKADNHLYFQDGAGVEKLLTEGSSDYGEMGNVYGSSAPEVINSADEWHGLCHANITGSAPHLNSGFSFVAGKLGSGNITTAQAGAAINIADLAHGLLDDDCVTVQSANHVGVGTVVYVDADNFEVDITYVGDEASTWQMGSYLLVATASTYRDAWNASFSQSDNATRTSIVTSYVNTTQSTKALASRALDNNTDEGSIGGNGLISLSVGDRIWFAAQSSDPQTLTFTVRNVSIQ